MNDAFGAPEINGKIIKAARELCAIKGLFITKKRYAVLIYDKEGKRKDQNGKPGEIKAMGLDLKRSDTPKTVQDFLQEVLVGVLTGADKAGAMEMIMRFRKELMRSFCRRKMAAMALSAQRGQSRLFLKMWSGAALP